METHTINDIRVKPVKIPKVDKEHIRGYDMFPELYANIYLMARKKSGKTSVIHNILKKCIDKNTTLFVFCSTHNKDNTWIEIKKSLEKRKINAEFYLSIKDGGTNILAEIINDLQHQDSESESSSEEECEILHFCEKRKVYKRKPKPPKMLSPKYLFIFDDISTELRDPNIAHLLKTNRHYRAKVIISSQWLNDILPSSRRQIDYTLVFSGISEKKLEELYASSDLSVPYEQYLEMYYQATAEKYSFFYFDTNGEYRINFNQKFVT